jgi:hypothetical protein
LWIQITAHSSVFGPNFEETAFFLPTQQGGSECAPIGVCVLHGLTSASIFAGDVCQQQAGKFVPVLSERLLGLALIGAAWRTLQNGAGIRGRQVQSLIPNLVHAQNKKHVRCFPAAY